MVLPNSLERKNKQSISKVMKKTGKYALCVQSLKILYVLKFIDHDSTTEPYIQTHAHITCK